MASLDRMPFPEPVIKHTGAMQPFSSRKASFAGWISISFRCGTSRTCKCRPNLGLHRLTSSYFPSGMQETPARLSLQGSSIEHVISTPLWRIFPLVPLKKYVLISSSCIFCFFCGRCTVDGLWCQVVYCFCRRWAVDSKNRQPSTVNRQPASLFTSAYKNCAPS